MIRDVRWILATTNAGKAKELGPMLAALGVTIEPLPPGTILLETGATFAENALMKARAAAELTQSVALADDSGLCVDALDGRPGVCSARFAGADGPGRDAANMARLLAELAHVREDARTASFQCALALAGPGGPHQIFLGELGGHIARAPRGRHGFGYDPVFLLDDGRTLAELAPAEKDTLSHRARAFEKLRERLLLEKRGGML